MIVVLAEKPSVARDIAGALGANQKKDGYFEGNDYQVTYAFGHLVTIVEPEEMKPGMGKPLENRASLVLTNDFKIRLDFNDPIKAPKTV